MQVQLLRKAYAPTRLFSLLVLLLLSIRAAAQVPELADSLGSAPVATTRFSQRLNTWRQKPVVRALLVPSLLIGAGALTTERVDMLETDEAVHDEVREHMPQVHTNIEDQLRYVPAYTSLGLSIVGVHGQHNTLEQGIIFFMAKTINDGLTSNLKRLTHVRRPDGSTFDSFPSQHTSAAFASATFLHKEYGAHSIWYSIGGYSVATATGALRILKERHWLSDVVAGAGVGILSTEAAFWVYPLLRRTAFKIIKRPDLGSRVLVMPLYVNGAVGASFALTLR
ncbi:phosphatase PAP2 family protein [Hymenobacter sp. GOD-10R]|uniref:phosphatase PAP2 family protein n=1 Tax=Hymenobacter sp. GOD-10R TaxID=3093922 RepID=UPI002D7869A2|nr:phosphatase PAP2 family protein [Hymenobacter sp. GOD-10R]WRQ29979.1 phosphatase PAP2 family protein [Hymenobacter sp. GOD-10R]